MSYYGYDKSRRYQPDNEARFTQYGWERKVTPKNHPKTTGCGTIVVAAIGILLVVAGIIH